MVNLNRFDVSERQGKLPNKTIALRYSCDNPLATSRSLKKCKGRRVITAILGGGAQDRFRFYSNDRYLSNECVSSIDIWYQIL